MVKTALPLQGTRVPSLVGELRSHKLHRAVKEKHKRQSLDHWEMTIANRSLKSPDNIILLEIIIFVYVLPIV